MRNLYALALFSLVISLEKKIFWKKNKTITGNFEFDSKQKTM